MKRFIGNKQVNTPLVLMLLAVLTINNGWLVSQTEIHTNDLASEEVLEVFRGNDKAIYKYVRDSHSSGGHIRSVPASEKELKEYEQKIKDEKASAASSPSPSPGPALAPAPAPVAGSGTPEKRGDQQIERNDAGGIVKRENLKATRDEAENFTADTFAKGSNGGVYEFTIKTECKRYEHIKGKICRVNVIQTTDQKKATVRAYDGDSDLENCDCLNNVALLEGEFSDIKKDTDWILEVTNKFSQKFADIIKNKGKKKKDGKGDDSGVSEEVRKKIYDCELAEGANDKNKGEDDYKLNKEEKLACIEKRIEELSNADEKDKDPFGRRKSAVLTNLAGKVKAHLKKCLANEDHREDSGCLEMAESIKDATEGSDVKPIHNVSHQMEILIAQGHSTIENTKYSEALKSLKSGMANASMVAERTGNFGPLQAYQNRLGMLHQQFLGSQLRRQQFLGHMDLDSELMNMNDLNGDSMMMMRLEEEFQNAATPNRFRNRMGGMNGMMNMRMGIPNYGMNGMQIPPYGLNGMNPLMMNGMMRPGMGPMAMGPMGPMGIRPMGMNQMMPPPLMYGQQFGQPYGMYRPQYYGPGYGPGYAGGPGLGFGLNFNASYGILPTSGPYGQYGNWVRPGGPGMTGPGMGPMGPGGYASSPTAGYYPPTTFQSPTPMTTVNPR